MGRFGALLLATCAVVAVVVLTRYEGDLDVRRAVAARCSMLAQLDAGPVEYAESGAGFPLLSIHGAGGGFDQGLANARDLVGSGYRIVAPSRFGYLRTAVSDDASVSAQAEVHAQLLSELGISRAVVVGVSAGARSAVELALSHPDRVAASSSSCPRWTRPMIRSRSSRAWEAGWRSAS